MALLIDTLRFAQRLNQAGVPVKQANAHAEAARDILFVDVATKEDLARATDAITRDLAALEQRLINRILLLVPATIGGTVAVVAALVALFPYLSKIIGK
jgi:hypothetical protein